jgi:N-methylhydantoinase A
MGIGPIRRPSIQPRQRSLSGGVERACLERRPVYFDGAFVETPVYARARLQPGDCLEGPAIVEEFGSTTVVLPTLCATVDDYANLLLTKTP